MPNKYVRIVKDTMSYEEATKGVVSSTYRCCGMITVRMGLRQGCSPSFMGSGNK